MKLFLLSIFVLATLASVAQQEVLLKIPAKGNTPAAFIPVGYDTLSTVNGDLNKDGVSDYVLVLSSREESLENSAIDPDSIAPRLLVVLLKDSTGTFRLAAKSASAVLCKSCGGVFGDPFAGVEIKNGILIVFHYGGSNWRWEFTHKFRYQQDDFYLIGQTTNSYFSVGQCQKLGLMYATEFKDINFVTGAYEEKKVSKEGCKLLVNKKGKQKIQPLIKLSAFSIEN